MTGNCIECGEETGIYCDYCDHWICATHRYKVKGHDACPKCFEEKQEEYNSS